MFKIEYDNKDFIAIMRNLASICAELVLEINDEGVKIRNVSSNIDVAVTVDMDKDDHKTFDYDGKNSTFITVPYGEFIKAMKKIKVPLEFTENGKAAVTFKSTRVKYDIKLLDEDSDIYSNHDVIMKKYTRDKRSHFKISGADMITLVDQLNIASAISVKIENKKIIFESLSGNLTAGYEMDIDVPDKFVWESAFSTVYMDLLAKLAVYTKELNFYVENADSSGEISPVIVEMDVSANSSIALVIGTFDKDASAGVGVDIDEESDEEADEESDEEDLDFEDDDKFYEEDDDQ